MKVAVVGGGFAGLAAAIALQERRHDVTLLERRGVLGGRATSFPDAVSGEDVDNGTHLMIGAYRDTLDLVRRAGASRPAARAGPPAHRLPRRARLVVARLPARCPRRCTSLAGLLGLRIPWRARLDAVRLGLAARFGRRPEGLTLAEWFDRLGQGADARRLVWDAARHRDPERDAGARGRGAVLRRLSRPRSWRARTRRGWCSCAAATGGCWTGWARTSRRAAGGSSGAPAPPRSTIDGGRGHRRRLRAAPTERDDIVRGEPRPGTRGMEADAVVSAVPWSALPAAAARGRGAAQEPFAAAARLTGSPIVSIEMWLDQRGGGPA